MKTRKHQRVHRHNRVRAKISGTTMRPRLSVFRSSKHMYAQIIDDSNGKTLVGMSDAKTDGKNKNERAEKLGEMIAKAATDKKITKVVFDRGGHAYIGRVKALAEGARKAGLQF